MGTPEMQFLLFCLAFIGAIALILVAAGWS